MGSQHACTVGLWAMLVSGLAAPASAHLEFFCASTVFSNHSDYCNKAVIWLGTYAHENIPDRLPVPGRAIVYRGASPVHEEPFSFEKYCARSTSTTGRFDTLSQPPTVSQLEDFIRGLTADDCMPGMEEELLGVAPTTELTCYGLNTNTRIADNESARCPSGRYSAGPILGALVPIVLTGVTSTDDISLIVHSAAYEIRRWPGPNDACSVASVEQIEPNNATCYMNILNWDGSTC